MEALFGFVLTPWIFISLMVIGFILNLILIEYESFGWNTFSVIILLVLLNWNYDLLSFIKENPFSFMLYVLAYFAVGVIWSFLKWYSKLAKHARKIKEIKKGWGLDWSDPKFWKNIASEIKSKIYGAGYFNEMSMTINEYVRETFPKITDNKSLVVAWIVYWPFSCIATIINDPVKRFANWLFYKFEGVYNSISKSIQNSLVKGDSF